MTGSADSIDDLDLRADPLAATISTPLGAQVIAATRLRGSNAASGRGATSFATAAVRAARGTACSGLPSSPSGPPLLVP
jgi:hypothetical protein